MSDFSAHGWGFQDGPSLCVGRVPTRSSVAVYRVDGNTSTILAYCTSEEAAKSLADVLGQLIMHDRPEHEHDDRNDELDDEGRRDDARS